MIKRMAGLDKVVEKLNSQKLKKKPQKVEEEVEEEESEEEEDLEEDLDEEDSDDDEEETEEVEEETPKVEQKKSVGVPKEQQEALRKRNEEINVLHNNGLYRYELLTQLIEVNDQLSTLNESFNKFFKMLGGKDGKK